MNTTTRFPRRALLLPMLALLGLNGCGEDEDTKSTRGWTGILSASVDGVPTQFTDLIRVEEINGNDAWVIGDAGTTQLQFYIESAAPGTYSTDSQGMGRFVPDTSLPGYDYSEPEGELRSMPGVVGGSITVEISTAERLSGTFSFQVATPTMSDTMTISDGVFDLRFGSLGTSSDPVGIWQHTVAGVEQQTFELRAGGTLEWITASWEAEICLAQTGSWSEDGDSLRITLDGITGAAAWDRKSVV